MITNDPISEIPQSKDETIILLIFKLKVPQVPQIGASSASVVRNWCLQGLKKVSQGPQRVASKWCFKGLSASIHNKAVSQFRAEMIKTEELPQFAELPSVLSRIK